ncbi:MAG TPA: methyltransferase domain-containing protein [Patescibacteria group bacterium]
MIKYHGLTTLEVLEEAENYNKWIADQFLPHLKGPILEIGSGTGNISGFFSKKSKIFLSDIDKGLISHLKKKYPKNKKQIIYLNIEKNTPKKFTGYFKTIIGINVLEHVKYDNKALKNLHSMLSKNGRLLLLIPAKKLAYTDLDRRLGHFRRYEKEELEIKLSKTGFKIEKLYSFNLVGLISWVVRNSIEKGNHLRGYQVIIFDKIVPILRIIEGIFPPPFGVSYIVRAKKSNK